MADKFYSPKTVNHNKTTKSNTMTRRNLNLRNYFARFIVVEFDSVHFVLCNSRCDGKLEKGDFGHLQQNIFTVFGKFYWSYPGIHMEELYLKVFNCQQVVICALKT